MIVIYLATIPRLWNMEKTTLAESWDGRSLGVKEKSVKDGWMEAGARSSSWTRLDTSVSDTWTDAGRSVRQNRDNQH